MGNVVLLQKSALPKWQEPNSTKEAAALISNLGRNMHEHAYLVGRTLLWVKKKLGHGEFLPWLEENVWFSQPTAGHMMRFATRCLKAGEIGEYHRPKLVGATNLTRKTKSKTPDDLGQFFAHKIRDALEQIPPKQRDIMIFWIQAALDEYKGGK